MVGRTFCILVNGTCDPFVRIVIEFKDVIPPSFRCTFIPALHTDGPFAGTQTSYWSSVLEATERDKFR